MRNNRNARFFVDGQHRSSALNLVTCALKRRKRVLSTETSSTAKSGTHDGVPRDYGAQRWNSRATHKSAIASQTKVEWVSCCREEGRLLLIEETTCSGVVVVVEERFPIEKSLSFCLKSCLGSIVVVS